MRNARAKALKGYKTKGYSWSKSIKSFKKTGVFKTRSGGGGHDAGYKWADRVGIDHDSKQRRYGKNSPSFDEGVYKYKQDTRAKALQNRVNEANDMYQRLKKSK